MALRDLQKPRRIIKLYHGTPCDNIEKFDIRASRKSFLDFGVGIYFTTNEEQAMLWSIKHSNHGVVYEVEIDASQLSILQFLTYSNDFIHTFCFCRAGLEEMVSNINNYDAVYGYVIDNDKDIITTKTNDYVIGLATPAAIRNSIKVYEDKDQLCIKSQDILNGLEIKRKRYTEYIPGHPRNRREAVKWKKTW